MESNSSEQAASKSRVSRRALKRSPSFKRKVSRSYRIMQTKDNHRRSSSSSSCSSSSVCSSSSSRKRPRTPSPEPRPTQPPKRLHKSNPRVPPNTVKYAVARSKHMRRIKYALSPISGRKVYQLEPSKTNQPTYASSGQLGSRVTASGIKYTYLLEKVLQAQLNSAQQQSGGIVYSDKNQLVQHPATIFNASSQAPVHVNCAATEVHKENTGQPALIGSAISTNQPCGTCASSNMGMHPDKQSQFLSANHSQYLAANQKQVYAHFFPAVPKQMAFLSRSMAPSSQANNGGTMVHLAAPSTPSFEHCRVDHEALVSSGCCGPSTPFHAPLIPGMTSAHFCAKGFALGVGCSQLPAMFNPDGTPIINQTLRNQEILATSPAPMLTKIEEEE